MEPMLHIIFQPRTIDVVENTGGRWPFQAGIISKSNIPPRLVTGKRLAGAFFSAIGPFSTPFMLVNRLHHVQIVKKPHSARHSNAVEADLRHRAS